ncbi:MAG: acyl-CoA thioesterase [Flavobacteriaceae bacterium]|nr:acyl-CoA thioesterase [Flavobacteriaceae bacterium]
MVKFQNTTKLRVRYGETDQMGIVHHSEYINYLEIARIEYLRARGMSYQELEDKGYGLPVVSIDINYKKPAKYDDELNLHTSLIEKGRCKLVFQTTIKNSEDLLVCSAKVTLVCVKLDLFKPTALPEFLLDLIL